VHFLSSKKGEQKSLNIKKVKKQKNKKMIKNQINIKSKMYNLIKS